MSLHHYYVAARIQHSCSEQVSAQNSNCSALQKCVDPVPQQASSCKNKLHLQWATIIDTYEGLEADRLGSKHTYAKQTC